MLSMEKLRKLLAVLFCHLFIMTEGAHAKFCVAKKKATEYEVEIDSDRNPLVLAENNTRIQIEDGENKSVAYAKVLINYCIPPMPRMAPMDYRLEANSKGGKHNATTNFIMAVPGCIVIISHHTGKTFTAKFNVDVP